MSLLNTFLAWREARRLRRYQRWLKRRRVILPKPDPRCQRNSVKAMPIKEEPQMARSFLSFDTAYIRWRAEFAPFATNCFDMLCEFVRAHFNDLMDEYYREGHEALNEFPAWAFERYLREAPGGLAAQCWQYEKRPAPAQRI